MFKLSKQFFQLSWDLLLHLHVPAAHVATTFEHGGNHTRPSAGAILREHQIELVVGPHELQWVIQSLSDIVTTSGRGQNSRNIK